MSSFEEKLRPVLYQVIAKTTGVDESTLTDETRPQQDLGAKSVNYVHIISAIEDEFELDIPFMKLRRQESIGDMIAFIADIYEYS